ncbi:protein mono-ADP-ribosyltransferase PARP15 [Pyxicephalus adspersus]|uniref:protein mono-ADP-ribosyltransferase PARP15 n=1 Tax=Pyxicephalus adspersus TaxID=30357 RepID=UPI003B5BEAA1
MITKANDKMVITKEGLNVNIKQGNIEDAMTNVVVNSVGKDLNLHFGAVSKALFGKAGNNLQNLLNKERQGRQVVDGSMFVTDCCNLSCDTVIHAVVPKWDGGNGSSERILRTIVRECLSIAENKQFRSITIPVIGTGILRFPKNTVASIMFEEILDFSSKNQLQYVKQVNIMVHLNDTENIKAFTSELEKKISSGGQKKEDKAKSLFGNLKNPEHNVYTMNIGSVNFKVKNGEIKKEKCDVIINMTDSTFNLKSGVSKVILEGAGPTIENECALLGTQPNNGCMVTQGGNLHCKNIIHVACHDKPHLLMQCITNALQMCETLQATTLALPAMETGAVLSAEMANTILDAMMEFVKSKPAVTVQKMKIIVSEQKMLKDFHDSMKKTEPAIAASQSWFSTLTYLKSSRGLGKDSRHEARGGCSKKSANSTVFSALNLIP